MDTGRFREEMTSFPALVEPADRQLVVLNWLTRLSHSTGCASPILVGCGAVELLTDSQTATGDVDIITPDIKELGSQLLELGFQRSADQRFWFHPGYSLLFEFPSEALHPWERTVTIEHEGVACLVISPEDLIVDRLETFEASGGGIDLVHAYLLYHVLTEHLDHQRLTDNIKRMDVRESFRFVRMLHEDAMNGKLSVDQQGARITEECRRRKAGVWPTGLS